MSDEDKSRSGGSRRTGAAAAAAPTAPADAQAVTVPADEQSTSTTPPVIPLIEEGDSEGRQTVPLAWVLENGERVLGIPTHALYAAFHEDEREELTLNAVRKTVAEFGAKVQNPETIPDDTAEEG